MKKEIIDEIWVECKDDPVGCICQRQYSDGSFENIIYSEDGDILDISYGKEEVLHF